MGGSTPDMPGQIVTDIGALHELRLEVAGLLNRNSENFPGAQPVSFARRHIEELKHQDYYVCEKTDGIRCLMYILVYQDQQVIYLIDRKNDYYQIQNIWFPKTDGSSLGATVLDGELVIDTLPGKGPQKMYLVFDCMVLDGDCLMHRSLDKRIAYFRDRVYAPYAKYRSGNQDTLPVDFVVDWKRMEVGYGTEKMFRETLPKLPHGNDGLIFTCRTTPYQCGTDQHILKWKPAHENSIDFRMTLQFPLIDAHPDDIDKSQYPDYGAMPQIQLAVFNGTNQQEIPYGEMMIDERLWNDLKKLEKPLNDQIVECSLIKDNQWQFLRFRDDKHEANHISTVKSVMESIQDKVSEEELIRASKGIRDAWKEREKASQNGMR